MGRIFFFLILVASATNAGFRERVTPYVQWAIDPLYEYSARWRLDEIAEVIAYDVEMGSPLPTTATLTGYLAENGYDGDSAYDPWGEPLYLEREAGSIRVVSAGADLTPGTEDDVHSDRVRLPGF